jgi:capsular polysaccharide biosynthesis protein
MECRSVFVFDSTYPSPEVALPIDEAKRHIIVSDREIEPPPGQKCLQLDDKNGLSTFMRNLRLMRAAWRAENGGKCIVISSPNVRSDQFVRNSLFALSLTREVQFFDGLGVTTLRGVWRRIVRSGVRTLGSRLFGGVKAEIKKYQFERGIKPNSNRASPESRLFGMYGRSRSFSLPLDSTVREPDLPSIYGAFTRGWYLPALSNRRQRFTVLTNRHLLKDIFLHIEDVGGSQERFLFKDGRVLDYPYLLGRVRCNAKYMVSTFRESRTISRGIDLLHFTSGYYHWLVEGVPRILDLIDDGTDFDRYPLILPPLEGFQRQVLEVLGISPDRQVITLEKDDWLHVDECISPTANFPFAAPGLGDPSGQPDGNLLRRIRERLLERLPVVAEGSALSPSRLYISRSRAAKRKFTIQAENIVRSILESRGFQPICLEDLPWAEQARLASSAEFIVGLHGAGLTNILFARGGRLLEFQNPLEARPYFALMARELNMKYAYILGNLDGQSSRFDNITIDPETLIEILRRLEAA